MPNWCYTNLHIRNDVVDLTELYNNLLEWTSKDYCKNSFGHGWLGNIVGFSGLIDSPEEINDGYYRCRGSVEYMELVTKHDIMIETETAWGPHVKVI